MLAGSNSDAVKTTLTGLSNFKMTLPVLPSSWKKPQAKLLPEYYKHGSVG